MPKIHRVGDYDSDLDRAVTGSPDVYANGGPTIGGQLAQALNLPQVVNVTDGFARAVLEGRAQSIAQGFDPDTFEPLEYGDGNLGGASPITGEAGVIASAGSLAASGGRLAERLRPAPSADGSSGTFDVPAGDFTVQGGRCDSEWLSWPSGASAYVKPEVCENASQLAQILGRRLYISSGYRDPETNRRVGGARNSYHLRGEALDIGMAGTTWEQRLQFVRAAYAAGFRGIGLYFPSRDGGEFIHVDIGPQRHWGPTGYPASQYDAAKPTLRQLGYVV
jgi:hypothetical protein